MLELRILVASEADRLLFEGLPHIEPVLAELGDGAILIGGLATTAWIEASDLQLPLRATRDVDLGIDRKGLRLSSTTVKVRPLLRAQGFEPRVGDEQFRFEKDTAAGKFLVDFLVAPGASRDEPPLLEAGLESLAAPGLAYAILRRPTALLLTLVDRKQERTFKLPVVKLDSAVVMKGALVASGMRMKRDRRITDTSDAIMLAGACTADPPSVTKLREHGRRNDVRDAVGWLTEAFNDEKSRAARRVEEHFQTEFGQPGGAAWAVEASARFAEALRRGA
jgi:hypothetical protein